jgi:ATP/maltotriose-dependent transcriptional regulator MalT
MTKETTFIYALKCPIFKDIRYIGQSKTPTKRLYQHINDQSNIYKSYWVKQLKSKRLMPILTILEEVDILIANEKEDKYINKYSQEYLLFNKKLNKDLNYKDNKSRKAGGRKRTTFQQEILNGIVPILNLTRTETLVANLIVNMFTYKEICKYLDISNSTLKIHTKNIRKKLDLCTGTNTKDWILKLQIIYNKATPYRGCYIKRTMIL